VAFSAASVDRAEKSCRAPYLANNSLNLQEAKDPLACISEGNARAKARNALPILIDSAGHRAANLKMIKAGQ